MAEISGRMILAIVETLTELFCVAVGRHILQFCGVRNSSHLASFFVGLIIWLLLACALVIIARS